jgi:hypothetical protein
MGFSHTVAPFIAYLFTSSRISTVSFRLLDSFQVLRVHIFDKSSFLKFHDEVTVTFMPVFSTTISASLDENFVTLRLFK